MIFWFLLSEHESFNFTALPAVLSVNENPKKMAQKTNTVITNNNLASVSDVQLALLSQDGSQQLRLATAKRTDILQALMLAEPTVKDNQVVANLDKTVLISTKMKVTPNQVKSTGVKPDKLSKLTVLPVTLNEQYYLDSEKGYVVQITGFSDLLRLEQFIKQNNEIEYFSYQRNLNAQQFFVLTSKIFSDKTQAREALNKLPQAINNLGAFLKSGSTIKREINTVSQ